MDRARVAPRSIPFHLLEEITDGFSDDQKLGVGAYGSVYKGLSKDGEYVAVKKLHDHMARLNDELFEKEYLNLACLEHQNIVRLVGYCNETRKEYITFDGRIVLSEIPRMALCFEYMCNGSLANYLQDESTGEDWHIRYAIIKGICKGLKYLHEELNPPVYHLDLKPDNILLDEKMTPKIADVGLSKLFGDERTRVSSSPIGTIGYLPPEYVNRQVVSNKLDIFSLGVIIIKLMTGRDGYSQSADLPSEDFIELIHEKWRKRLQRTSSDAVDSDAEQVKTCIKIALSCVEEDRHKRPKIGDIVIELDDTETTTRFSHALTINRGLTTVEEEEVVNFPSIQDNKQCTISDDSSLQSGTAHVQVNDDEPTSAPPNPGTEAEPGRVQLVVKINKTAPLSEYKQTVMLELTGGDDTSDRPGLDLVLVVDVSSNMRSDRMEELLNAMKFVMWKLSIIDRLSIVTYSYDATELCPLQQMTEISREELLKLSRGIEGSNHSHSSHSNIEAGLLTGLKVLADRKVIAGRLTAIILMCENQQSRGNACAVSVDNVPVYTFGFGAESDHTVLNTVAANSMGGTFSHIPEEQVLRGGLTMAFSQCIAGLLTVSVQDLQLTVEPVGDEMNIVKTTSGSYRQFTDSDGSMTIMFGNLYSGEVRNVIVDLHFAAGDIDHSFEFLKVTYSYNSSSSSGGRERFVRPLTVWRTNGVHTLEEEEKLWLSELHAEKARLQAAELIQKAVQCANVSLAQSHQMLVDAQNIVMLEEGSNPLLKTELRECHEFFQTEENFMKHGCAYALSLVSSHSRQRFAARGSDVEIIRLFVTPCMDMYLEEAKKDYQHFAANLLPGFYWGDIPNPRRRGDDNIVSPPRETSRHGGVLRLWPWRKRS